MLDTQQIRTASSYTRLMYSVCRKWRAWKTVYSAARPSSCDGHWAEKGARDALQFGVSRRGHAGSGSLRGTNQNSETTRRCIPVNHGTLISCT